LDKRFDIYLTELVEWNKKFNLTAITDPAAIRQKHFADSLLLLQARQLTSESVVDVGAGAGFPGLPLKLACPDIKLTLLEATKKKVEFLNHLIKVLGLTDTEAVWGRAEEFALQHREEFDLAVARAVADLRVLAELCLPLVKVGGRLVAYKEERVDAEVESAGPALELLGGQWRESIKFPARSLVIIDKVHPTPPAFPRRAGMAKKRPL